VIGSCAAVTADRSAMAAAAAAAAAVAAMTSSVTSTRVCKDVLTVPVTN